LPDLNGEATKWRVFAGAVDNLFATILCVLIAAKLPGELSAVTRWGIAAAGYLAYFLIQEAVWRTTLGKRAFGLVVARLDGQSVGWREAGWRTVLRILEVNPLLFGAIPGGLAVTWSKRKQRLGDMLAGTVVVRRKALTGRDTARAQAAAAGRIGLP
jgi:uncharacterized RDD family membrane protein YckC